MIKKQLTSEKKILKAIQLVNESAQWTEDNLLDNHGDAEFYMFESVYYLNDLRLHGSDLEELVESLTSKGISEHDIIELIKEHGELVLSGIYTHENSAQSWILGELEDQVEALGELELTKEEEDRVNRHADAYLSGDCVYTDHHYDVLYWVVDVEKIESLYKNVTGIKREVV